MPHNVCVCVRARVCVCVCVRVVCLCVVRACVRVSVTQNEKHNARLSDKDDRKELERYYESLTPKTQLLRQRVMSQELKATQQATLAHKQAEAAREREISLLLFRCQKQTNLTLSFYDEEL